MTRNLAIFARYAAPYISVTRFIAQGHGKIAEKARIEVEEGLQELSKACFIRQEKQVMQLQSVVLQHVHQANAMVDEQVGFNLLRIAPRSGL